MASSWLNIVFDVSDWDVPASYYMFAFCVVFVLVSRLCEGGAESPHPPLEIIRVDKKPHAPLVPPKLFAEEDKPAPENKIHLSTEIRDTIRQQKQQQEEQDKTRNDSGKKEEEEKVNLLETRLSVLEKLVGAMDARMNTLEDWVQVETDLQEQDILMRAKAHDRANNKKKK